MVSSVTSGGNATQLVRQARQAERQQKTRTDNQQASKAEQTQTEQAKGAQLKAEQEQAQQNRKPPAPTVNTQGQVTGRIVNTTA